jgi:hypothetical protein
MCVCGTQYKIINETDTKCEKCTDYDHLIETYGKPVPGHGVKYIVKGISHIDCHDHESSVDKFKHIYYFPLLEKTQIDSYLFEHLYDEDYRRQDYNNDKYEDQHGYDSGEYKNSLIQKINKEFYTGRCESYYCVHTYRHTIKFVSKPEMVLVHACKLQNIKLLYTMDDK